MNSINWVLFGWSFIGALFSNLAIHGNKLILPKISRGQVDLGAITILISAMIVYGFFIPHNPQTAIISGIAIEDLWVVIKEKARLLRARAGEYTPPVSPIEDGEKIEELQKEYEYMKPERDEN